MPHHHNHALLYLIISLFLLTIPLTLCIHDIQEEQSKLKQYILVLQDHLLPTNEAISQSRKNVLQNRLDQALQNLANSLKKSWKKTPRPAERIDNPNAELIPGSTPLWYLMEIPQWWVTGTLIRVINENQLVVQVTSTGQEEIFTRGSQVRVVAEEDKMLWQSEFWRDQGELARINQQSEKRRECYEKALQIDPNNPHALDNLGLYYRDVQNDIEQSNLWLEKSIQANPNWYHAYYNLGLNYRDYPQDVEKDQRKALELFETAFRLNPLFLDSLWNIAELHSRLRNPKEACFHWRLLQTLNRNPSPDERDFGVWNESWEQYTAVLIEDCMGGETPIQPAKKPKAKDESPDFMKMEL